MVSFNNRVLIAACILSTSSEAFSPVLRPSSCSTYTTSKLDMGLFDMFSEEARKEREEQKRKRLAEEEEALREMMERRRNPDKMEKYFDDVQKRRNERNEERDVWSFQSEQAVNASAKNGEDDSLLKEWKKKREDGDIKVGSDLKRDEGTRRLGSEGLVEVRTDERLPYIDQGYVDESSDMFGNFFKNFQKKE